jgi:indolepyruvate ferredoxin oxidoreductase alpha subunit
VPVEKITEALGLPTFLIDPVDIKKSIDVMKKTVEVVKTGKPAVVVSRRPCTLIATRKARRAGLQLPKYRVEPNKCTGCGLCYNLLRCSAISKRPDKKAYVDPSLCVGCGMWAEVCPFGAFVVEGRREQWLELWRQA